MQILPVLDLLNGVVVRGVAGRRDEYRPVNSRIAARPDALSVARAFRERLGLNRLYVADLDAILYDRPNRDLYRALADDGFELLVDAGLRRVPEAVAAIRAGALCAIAGLETWPGPDELRDLCREIGRERVIFSVDLQHGRPLGNLDAWQTEDPFRIACQAVSAGAATLLILDLAQVGMSSGVTTTELCRKLLAEFPGLPLITGGGIRDGEDLALLASAGIDQVLLASALHDGTISRADIERAGGSYTTTVD